MIFSTQNPNSPLYDIARYQLLAHLLQILLNSSVFYQYVLRKLELKNISINYVATTNIFFDVKKNSILPFVPIHNSSFSNLNVSLTLWPCLLSIPDNGTCGSGSLINKKYN